MDTSFWIRYNPKISVENTTKKFYGKYLYKIVLWAPAGRAIDDKKSIKDSIAHRQALSQAVNYGWYFQRLNKDLDKADVLFLEKMRELRHSKLPGIKMRVEEPYIQIYAESISDLENLVVDHLQFFPHEYIITVSSPADPLAEEALNSGAIIRKKDIGFRYKVVIRDGKYPADAKRNIMQYIGNLGPDQALMPRSCFDMLNKITTGYVWNCYFYINDPALVIFLNLMYPGMVLNIHELVVMDNK